MGWEERRVERREWRWEEGGGEVSLPDPRTGEGTSELAAERLLLETVVQDRCSL